MSDFRKSLVVVVVVVAALLLIGGLLSAPVAPSYADTVPTPAVSHNPSGDALYVPFWSAEAITTDTASSSYQLMRYELLDIQYVADVGTVNTTTVKLQYSNDDTNWSDGPTVASAIAADGDGMVQANNFGRYTRMYATVTAGNANAITFTIKAVAK